MIISKEDIAKFSNGIELIEGSSSIPGIVVKMSVQEYFDFCKSHGVQIVYYNYEYYDIEKYLVNDVLIDMFISNQRERDYCKQWADSYNDRLKNLYYSRPYSLTLIASIGVDHIILSESDKWLPPEIEEGSSALMKFLDDHANEIDELFELDNEDVLELSDELKVVLLDDAAFRCSTTISSRKQYVREFLSKSKNKKYLELVRRVQFPWEKEDQFRDIVNRIYEEYRNNCKRLKLHIGDPLPKEEREKE